MESKKFLHLFFIILLVLLAAICFLFFKFATNKEESIDRGVEGECGIESLGAGLIRGGRLSRKFEAPWKVAVFKRSEFICGGVLIDSINVLTGSILTFNSSIQKLLTFFTQLLTACKTNGS